MQYLDLNALLREHGGDSECSLQILGFPCNQFGKQEPGKNSEILNGLKYVRPGNGYQPNFPLFKKRDVNGKNEDKIFKFLKASCPPSDGFIDELRKISWDPVKSGDIPWNFEKFLISHKGEPVGRYSAPAEPKIGGEIHSHIRSLITQCRADKDGKQEKERYEYIKEEWKYDYL